ncbi:putative reverse transcriptase domain, ribonuclease H-like domain protein [Tanacetum coccineum]
MKKEKWNQDEPVRATTPPLRATSPRALPNNVGGNLPLNVDFLPEIPFDDIEKKVKEKEVSDPSNEWKLYTDGASSSDGAGTGLMLIDPAGKEYTYALRFEFETTNNEAEYEALLAGLRIAQEMEITKVVIFLDSQLVVNQIKGTYAAKQLSITALKGFEGYTVGHVRRNQNKKADALSKLASMTFEHLTKEVEAAKAIQYCDKYKERSAIRKAWADGAIAVESTWPFSHWGIHILGPLPMAPQKEHETNKCRELKHQIEEAVKTGQLTHLVKGVTKKREKTSNTQSGEKKKEEKPHWKKPLSLWQVNRAYLDNGSSCEVIYEHCFLKLKPSMRSLRVDSDTPLVGFSGEDSWPLGEISLEVTIGEGPLTITKTLTFIIVRSDSPHNLLLGRTAMQEIGIVVSTVHGAIKFHMPNGVGTIFSEHNSQRLMEEEGNSTNNGQGDAKDILSCIDIEEKIVIDDEYPEQKVTIGRQLPTRIKMRVRDLLRAHADVFAWTTTHITGVPRTLIIGEETFSIEHQLNVFNHTESVKQKKRSLAPERNEAVRTQVEELVEAGVLREVKY